MSGHILTRADPALRRRRILAWSAVSLLLGAVTVATLTLGELGIPIGGALRALIGVGEPGTILVVREWRLPRALIGIAVGAMLALSGALFQIVTRNPLGSPDILGFSTGAFTGVLLVMNVGAVSVLALTSSAFAGGLAAAVLVFALSSRAGVHGFALVVTGIAITAMLSAVNTVIILRSDDLVALSAAIWATGSLNGVDAQWLVPSLATLAVTGGLVAWMSRALVAYELGDERASTLGARPTMTRWGAMLLGVALISVATAVTGPIGFIALAAPQIARRLWRTGTIPLGASALTGALLLCLSDLISARLFAPTIIPTGLVTVSIGGIYLAWLLTTRERTTR